MLGYDHEKDAGKIQQEMKKLFSDCEAAQEDIAEEIERRKELFNAKGKKLNSVLGIILVSSDQ